MIVIKRLKIVFETGVWCEEMCSNGPCHSGGRHRAPHITNTELELGASKGALGTAQKCNTSVSTSDDLLGD